MENLGYTQAAEEVRKILRGFKAVEEVSAALDKMGSLETATKEQEAAHKKITEVIAAAKAEHDRNLAAFAAQQKAAKAKLDKAHLDANNVIGMAKAEAAQIIKTGQEDLEKVLTLITEAKHDLVTVTDQVALKEVEVKALEAKLTKIRAQLSKLMET
jgi:predicted  nucleic acid-binding Zn-ribbon protein